MIGGLTYIYFIDNIEESGRPSTDVMISFVDYNEAMSYAKWVDVGAFNGYNAARIYVWNWNGGSGYWENNVFNATENNNYPTP